MTRFFSLPEPTRSRRNEAPRSLVNRELALMDPIGEAGTVILCIAIVGKLFWIGVGLFRGGSL